MMNLLYFVERNNSWFFTTVTACLIADLNDIYSMTSDLSYYVTNEMIEYVGEDIYAFKIMSMIPTNAQELLVHALRPNEINYLSFESILNKYGIISQIPTIVTIVTTGESGLYESDSYRIEFTHIEHSQKLLIIRIIQKIEEF